MTREVRFNQPSLKEKRLNVCQATTSSFLINLIGYYHHRALQIDSSQQNKNLLRDVKIGSKPHSVPRSKPIFNKRQKAALKVNKTRQSIGSQMIISTSPSPLMVSADVGPSHSPSIIQEWPSHHSWHPK